MIELKKKNDDDKVEYYRARGIYGDSIVSSTLWKTV